MKLLAVGILALAFLAPARGPDIVQVRVGDDVASGFVVGDGENSSDAGSVQLTVTP